MLRGELAWKRASSSLSSALMAAGPLQALPLPDPQTRVDPFFLTSVAAFRHGPATAHIYVLLLS